MKMVNVHQAKTYLSRLLAEVLAGEEVIISKAGKPVAKLVPVTGGGLSQVMGIDRGRVWMSEDFDAPLPDDILAGFEGTDPGHADPP